MIQTDAPINPGNSGGVLVDIDARLIGVPTAIESSSGVNAGIGFVVPSVIVQKVVPALIEKGSYEYPWIGIKGTTLTSDIAEKMDLSRDQRGALVVDVIPDSPAEDAGLLGSDRLVTVDEQDVRIGGDVITRIDNTPVQDFEDLTAYLARYTTSGQNVELTVIRDDVQEIVELTLGIRPTTQQQEDATELEKEGNAWLGIIGLTMSSPIAEEMDLPSDQSGVLIQQVVENSPADNAGLRGSYKSITIGGEQVLIGGDIVTKINTTRIKDEANLLVEIKKYEPADEITVTVLRDGEMMEVGIILGTRP